MAKLNFGVSPTSVILRVKLLNSSVTTGAGLTGLTSTSTGLIISTIQIGEATATAYTVAGSTIETITTLGTYAAPTATKCRFKEVDATNHKGVYEIQLADARFASTGSLIVSLSGATNLAETDFEVQCTNLAANVTQWLSTAASTPTVAGVPNVNVKTWNDLTTVALPLVPTTPGRTLDVSATGEAGVDWANVGSPTTANSLTATTIATTQKVDIETIKTNPVVNAGTVTFPTTATLASTTNITAGVITTATNLTNAPTSGDLTATMKTSVNAEVVDALATDTYAEPGQGAPAATATLSAKINYLYKAWRNKFTQTSTTYSLYADDTTTVDQKATVSDDGTTLTKGEIATGP